MLLTYALLFLLVALIANVLGFAGVGGVATIIAAICFGLFLGLFLDALGRNKPKHKGNPEPHVRPRHEH
jgi:uncharacterized membrane protein YtjA (UPF0391 family)